MKRLYLSLIAIALGLGAMAQDSRVATLQHGTNFRAYYGTDAFISAHADAADGDVITLTAGEFDCPEITKAITVRGEGMNRTSLRDSRTFQIPQGSLYSLCLEGLSLPYRENYSIRGTEGTATIIISKCRFDIRYLSVERCNTVIVNSDIRITGDGNGGGQLYNSQSSVICTNSKLSTTGGLSGNAFDIQNCVIGGNVNNVTNSIIKNSIIYGVSTIDNTNTTSNCLLKDGSSGFANSWYVKTEPDVNPDPWAEDPETPVLWDELFGEDYHLTDAAAATYLGTDGTQVGIWGGAYPWDETPDYPLVKNLEVKGINENGKLQVKINVE